MKNKIKQFKSTVPEYKIRKKTSLFPKIKITDSSKAVKFARSLYDDDIGIYESFYAIFLNRANNTRGYFKLSQGGTVGTVVDIKLLGICAIEHLTDGVILVHNHPSGNCKPSESDIKLTESIVSGLDLLDIKVLDHVIITEDIENYFSFADNELI